MAAVAETSPVIKILVVGDAGVGKTSIIQRYIHNEFSPTYKPTGGIDFSVKEIALESTRGGDALKTVCLQLWDIAGQDRLQKSTKVYFKGALGAFIVYDISRPQTFDSASKWKEELDSSLTLPNGNKIPVVLLGNKMDLEVATADVPYIDRFVRKHGFIAWSDTSAKDERNADFEWSVACLIKKVLHDEQLFGTGIRRSASSYSEKILGEGVGRRSLQARAGRIRLTVDASEDTAGPMTEGVSGEMNADWQTGSTMSVAGRKQAPDLSGLCLTSCATF